MNDNNLQTTKENEEIDIIEYWRRLENQTRDIYDNVSFEQQRREREFFVEKTF